MTGWALTRWRALTRYSTVHAFPVAICLYVCGPKKVYVDNIKCTNRTLAIDSSFQTFMVKFLVKFIDTARYIMCTLHYLSIEWHKYGGKNSSVSIIII